MMRRRTFAATRYLVTLAVLVLVSGGSALATGPDEFIRKTGERTFESLGIKDLSDEERARRFRDILHDTFDIEAIARFTLGRYWRVATDQQRKEYVDLFEEFIVQAYAFRFKDLEGHKFEITGSQSVSDKDTLVESQVVVPNNAPVRVLWRVRSKDDMMRIRDVVVEGVSMSVTQRDEFASVISNSGGKVEGLLRALRKKTGKN
jgi:phospholipid transport system substrate-binding protein